MKKLIDYVSERLKFNAPAGRRMREEALFIATPHKLIMLENILCHRCEENLVLEFSIRNLGGEIRCFGLKLINNFDREGNEYDYILSFGKSTADDRTMIHYTLPHDIPIKVRVEFSGVADDVHCLAQVKFSGLCLHNRRHNPGYNPSGTILIRNIPVLDI